MKKDDNGVETRVVSDGAFKQKRNFQRDNELKCRINTAELTAARGGYNRLLNRKRDYVSVLLQNVRGA